MGVAQNWGLGVPIVRTIVFWGLYWGLRVRVSGLGFRV